MKRTWVLVLAGIIAIAVPTQSTAADLVEISGSIRNDDGSVPTADLRLSVLSGNTQMQVEVINGDYVVQLPIGKSVTFVFSFDNEYDRFESIRPNPNGVWQTTLVPSKDMELNLRLPPLVILNVQVVGPDDQPIPYAYIQENVLTNRVWEFKSEDFLWTSSHKSSTVNSVASQVISPTGTFQLAFWPSVLVGSESGSASEGSGEFTFGKSSVTGELDNAVFLTSPPLLSNKDRDVKLCLISNKSNPLDVPKGCIEEVLMAEKMAEAKVKEEERAAAEAKVKEEERAAAEAKVKEEERAAAEAKARAEEQVPSVTNKKSTIVCLKGKKLKKVTAINPKCPKGYKKK